MMGQFSTPQLERIDEDSLSTPPPVPPLPASFLRPAMVVGEPVDRDVTSPTDVVRPSPHVPVIKRPRTSSDAAKHLSLMTARLDSQISALGSVFGKIKAKQMEKSEKLRCGDGGCALVNPSASPSVSRLSISSYRTLNVSQSTSHLPFVSAAPPVSQLRRGSDARPLPPRTDSGFEKSELDLLFSDFRALSLGELAEKYGEGGEDDDQRVPAMEVMVL
ncbi:hypothetical protein HKX48_008624 [Thoreauomyces humboldtii]|nr:hypothetical protein HKX48_008624 [Thoreauomyces humboldtii]